MVEAGRPIQAADPYVRGELIVKYREGFNAPALAPSPGQRAPSFQVPSSSLDALHKRLHLKTMRRAFTELEKKNITSRSGFLSALRSGSRGAPAFQDLSKTPDLQNIYHLSFEDTSADMEAVAREYRRDPNVEYAHPDYIFQLAAIPNDPDFLVAGRQWAHTVMRSTAGWDRSTGANTVTIAIVDTGVDWSHPDLAANIWSNSGETAGNGVDDDHNGFIDDIRGWDFINVTTTDPFAAGEDIGPPDNNPVDVHGHGTKMAGIASAVGNNGVGMTGMTWNCKIMPLKVGIAERVNSNAYTQTSWISDAIFYAARNGASVINLSLVSSNWPNAVKDAIDFAYAQGAVIVAGAGNEDVGFPTYPAAYDKVIGVAATDESNQRSIWGAPQPSNFYLGNASNHGTWVKVAAPGSNIYTTTVGGYSSGINGTSCSTAFVSGLAALIRSLRPSLTNAQVMKIISSTTDRVTSDKYIGTGRINVDRALAMSAVPTADITSPTPLQVIATNVNFIGSAGGTSYSLEYGQGLYPASWTPIVANSNQTVTNGILGTWNVGSLQDNTAYTVRLSARDANGNTSTAEVLVYIQKNVQAGWPRNLAGELKGDGLVIDDIDGGGDQEIVAMTRRVLGVLDYAFDLHMLKSNGAEALGWPKMNLLWDTGGPSLADVTGDGRPEVLVGGYTFFYPNYTTRFYVLDQQGNDIPGWPKIFGQTGIASQPPVVGDLDNDGAPEIVFASKWDVTGQTATISVYRFNGTLMPGWPKTFDLQYPPSISPPAEIIRKPCLVDLDNNGTLEIVVGVAFHSNVRVYALRSDGSVMPGWPKTLPSGFNLLPVAADIDHNGTQEIVGSTADGIIYVWNADGTPYAPWPVTVPGVGGLPFHVVADLDGDRNLEIIARTQTDQMVVYHHNGVPMTGWPKDVQVGTGFMSWPQALVGDISGDGQPDIVQAATDDPMIYAWQSTGTLISGWPKVLPLPAFTAPALGDLDNDGQLEMAVGYSDVVSSSTIDLMDLGIPYSGQNLQWPMAGFDAAQTNAYSPPDGISPVVAFTAPADGATVSGLVTLQATASDNVRVLGVRFAVDGVTVDREDTLAPYSVIWNTSGATNGSHTLTAISRDQAGNTAMATRTITLFNLPNQDFTAPRPPRGIRVIQR
jgi:subtilisin family serine protease